MLLSLAAIFLIAQDAPSFPPHYAGRPMTCPVGGEAFQAPSLMHYSTFGALPDGQPMGSVAFPVLLAECPGNGLVIYTKFAPETVTRLTPLVASAEYRALRASETSYYRAYWLANALGDHKQAMWLMLSASWEAKNQPGDAARVTRYNSAFVAGVQALAPDAKDGEGVALRARAANALRELGRFDEAETLRAGIVIDPAMGGSDDRAAKNREGWAEFLRNLAAPIARRDSTRYPIDLRAPRQAGYRCIAKEIARPGETVEPLTPFETEYCATPVIAKEIAEIRKQRQ